MQQSIYDRILARKSELTQRLRKKEFAYNVINLLQLN